MPFTHFKFEFYQEVCLVHLYNLFILFHSFSGFLLAPRNAKRKYTLQQYCREKREYFTSLFNMYIIIVMFTFNFNKLIYKMDK